VEEEEVVVEVQEDKKVASSELRNEKFPERRMAKVEKAEKSEVKRQNDWCEEVAEKNDCDFVVEESGLMMESSREGK